MKLAISVSGGGALGIGPLQFMCRLEQDLGRKLSDESIAFAGTSTGSIIAAGLGIGKSAHELYDLYRANLKKIFTKYPWYKRSMPKVPTYDNSNLKKLLQENFKGTMEGFTKPIFIPVTYMNGESVEKVWDRDDRGVEKWFAVLTSCSAPTYFDVVVKDGKSYCDGGMHANDPIMTLESGLNMLEGYRGKYKILSFDTGMTAPNTESGNQTLVGWAEYIMSDWVARSGMSNYYEACANIGKENVFRCSPKVDKKFKMDDLDVLDKVVEIWDRYYDSVRDDVLRFVKSV